MGDWRAKQRALRKYTHDAPTRHRGSHDDDPSVGAPVGGPGGGGHPGGAAAAVPIAVNERASRLRN